VKVPWGEAIKGTLLPKLSKGGDYWATVIAVFGTTISPYLFFWQASQETEEIRNHDEQEPLKVKPHQAPAQLERIRLDTVVGMLFSNLVAYFIILAAAVTLHTNGVTDVQTADQAAQALPTDRRQIRFRSVRHRHRRHRPAGRARVSRPRRRTRWARQ